MSKNIADVSRKALNYDLGGIIMIKMTVKLKDDNYMPKVDVAFVKLANMKKVDEGRYESDQDVLMSCYNSAEELMKRGWFRENVISMVWKVDEDDESDLVKHFIKRINEGKINVIN